MCFYQNLVLVAECRVACWQTLQWRLLWRISTAPDWSQSKQVKEHSDTKNLFAISMGKTRYRRHLKYQNLCMNNKVRSDKNAICLHFSYLLNICRKFEFFISQGSVATCVRWDEYCIMNFVANFIGFSAVQKFWKSVKIWQSYREFKGGNFFETQCRLIHISIG